jgi:hypothetical protein
METRLGQMFHSSATGRRREQTLHEATVFVKHGTHKLTLREVSAARRTTKERCIPPGLLIFAAGTFHSAGFRDATVEVHTGVCTDGSFLQVLIRLAEVCYEHGAIASAQASAAYISTLPSSPTVQPGLCAISHTYPSGSANAPDVPPHSARAARRRTVPPACSASARTAATSSGERTL